MNPNDFHPSAPGRLVKTSQGYWAFCADPLPPELAWTGALIITLAVLALSIIARLLAAQRKTS